jgi:RNA-binding protein
MVLESIIFKTALAITPRMKLAHTVAVTVFVKGDDDEARIRQALLSLVPLDIEREKINLKKTVMEASASHESKIIIFEAVLEKERHTTRFIEELKGRLSAAQLHELAHQENRVDDECSFYMRLDKKKLLSGEYALTDSGDCFHIKMSITAFPKKREAALAVVKKMFS